MYFLTQHKTFVCIAIALGSALCIGDQAYGQSCTYIDTVPPVPTYTVTSPLGGNGGIQDNGVSEQRATVLSSSYTVNFNCSGVTTVDLTLLAAALTGPRFSAPNGGLNLDWLTGTTGTGVTHLVTVKANGNTLITDQTVNATGTIIAPAGLGNDLPLDGAGNLALQIDSRFTTTGGAEEMAQGNYRATFQAILNPSAIRQTNITGNVAKECSVQVMPTASVPYTIVTTLGGTGGTIQDHGTQEERATQLSATNTAQFDCNSAQVAYTVFLSNLTAPKNLGNNLDLVTGAGQIGVDHKVTASFTYPTTNAIGSTFVRTAPTNVFSGTTAPNDDGDIGITVTSSFETVNGAEEMAAGTYGTTMFVTVTAQ